MMTGFRAVALAACLAGCASATRAAAVAAQPAAHVEPLEPGLLRQALVLSGLHGHVERLPQQVRETLEAQRGRLGPVITAKLRQALDEGFEAGALERDLLDGVRQRVPDGALREVIDWLRTPVGQRLTQMHLAPMTESRQEALEGFAVRTQFSPLPEARTALIERLDAAVGGTETALRIMRAVTAGLARISTEVRDLQPLPAETLEEQLAQVDSQRDVIAHNLRLRLLFTFQDASDEELRQYVECWESPSGRAFGAAATAALEQAVALAFDRSALRLHAIVQEDRAP